MNNEKVINKLEMIIASYLLSGKADNDTCGEWREVLDKSINALKRESCDDAISREYLLSKQEIIEDDDGIMHPVISSVHVKNAPSINSMNNVKVLQKAIDEINDLDPSSLYTNGASPNIVKNMCISVLMKLMRENI